MSAEKNKDEKYKILPVETAKNQVPLRSSMKNHIIEKYPCSTIISGRSGSGKSCLVNNLLSRKEFYGGYYHTISLFSPTAGDLDDTYDSLDLDPANVFNTFDPEMLNEFLEGRKAEIKKNGIEKTVKKSRVLLIFDDIIASNKFLKSKEALILFCLLRHYLCSVMILTQSYTKIPRALRLQANGTYIFPASRSEVEVLKDELCPPGMKKKEFEHVIADATGERYSFMHINNNAPKEKKLCRNMGEVYY